MKRAPIAAGGNSGFSLIELLTVMVIVAVLMSVAVPSMAPYIDRMRTRRALDRVVSDVAFARLTAIQNGRRTAVRFGTDGTYTVDTLSAAGTWGALRTTRLRDDFSGVSISSSENMLEFNSRGLIHNIGDGFIRMQRGGARDSVFVAPTGRIYRDF
jgi:prepilin-type N-terminal cleavage/methylation domain-containing protein